MNEKDFFSKIEKMSKIFRRSFEEFFFTKKNWKTWNIFWCGYYFLKGFGGFLLRCRIRGSIFLWWLMPRSFLRRRLITSNWRCVIPFSDVFFVWVFFWVLEKKILDFFFRSRRLRMPALSRPTRWWNATRATESTWRAACCTAVTWCPRTWTPRLPPSRPNAPSSLSTGVPPGSRCKIRPFFDKNTLPFSFDHFFG